MLISSKGRYALRLAVCIAQAGPEAKVSLREVAEREELSLKYLEQIARPMVSAGLLASVRGKGGGYRLARDPQDILAGDVLRAVEGTTVPVTCAALDGPEPCHRADVCTTVRFWAGLDEVIEFKHTAYSKAVFAKGAVSAAKFLKGKGPGYYDMSDVIEANA